MLLTILYILLILALVALMLWFIERYITPIDSRLKGILIAIVLILLIIWAVAGHGIRLF